MTESRRNKLSGFFFLLENNTKFSFFQGGNRGGGGTETQVLGDNLVVSASVLNYLLTARF